MTRASLTPAKVGQPGYNTAGADVSSSVVYRVPLNRASGGPYDLTGPEPAKWAQVEAPTDAAAIFGPDTPQASFTATSSAPGAAGYGPATVHYLNASGKTVNTASPVGPGTPAGVGDIDTVDDDRFGNVVRSLNAINRRLALGQLPVTEIDTRLNELGLKGVSPSPRRPATTSGRLTGSDLWTRAADGSTARRLG